VIATEGLVVRKSGTMMSDARKVRPQHHDDRRRLGELVQHFESDTNLHSKYFLGH
jgi:hypothetical protein